MIKTTAMLLDELHEYRAPANKLARMVNQKEIHPIIRGLYETNLNTPGHLLAASLYGPSYLSFEYALSHWHLIPEAVYTYTSATFDKRKKRQYETSFGHFTYRDVPKKAYPVGIRIIFDSDYAFPIAEPEKALCDQLYTISPVFSQKSLTDLLFNDLRIEEDEYHKLDKNKLIQYAKLYHTSNHRLLITRVRRTK